MDDWILEINEESCKRGQANNEKGAFIGNGKIGLFASFAGGGTQQCMIAGEFKTNRGVFKSNTIDTFRTSEWKMFRNSTDFVTIRPVSQRLNMKIGVLTSENEFTDQETGKTIKMSSDLYATRQLPYCVVHTLRLSSDTPIETLMFHDVSASENMQSTDFAYSMIDVDLNSAISPPMSLLMGKGIVDGVEVCFASCIVCDNVDDVSILGFNRYVNESNKCYLKLRVKTSTTQVKLHCITVHMTSFDFESPYDECKMVMMSILNKQLLLSLNTIQRIREDHVSQWAKVWKFGININKIVTTDAFVDKINKKIKQNLYMVFSCTRENLSIEVNPSTFGIIDSTNASIYDGDLFLVPLLLFAMPSAARALLEYRYNQLSQAIQVAATYGFAGAKFPYVSDTMGYRNALYWDALAPMYLFNNALIAMNVWNYYRVTVDREWLTNKGYTILKSCADFFISRSTVDEYGVYHLNDVIAFNRAQEPSNDNSFTNNVVKLALKAAIEASHELGYPVKKEWHSMLITLSLNISLTGLETYEVVMYDSKSTPTNILNAIYTIVEQLFVLTPMMSELYFVPGTNRGFNNVKRNVDFYIPRMSYTYENHPINTMLITSMYALCNKYNTTYMTDFASYIESKFINNNSNVWGQETDINVAAILPLVFLNSVAGVNIQGGVSETKFYYNEMTIKGLFATNMPSNWASITVSNCGSFKKSFVVFNQNIN